MSKNTARIISFLILIGIIMYAGITITNANKTQKQDSIAPVAISDEVIEAKIQTAYEVNQVLGDYSIRVESNAGKVTLKGAVQNAVEKDLAVAIASEVPGVQTIQDNIIIDKHTKSGEIISDFGQRVTDATITALVKTRLLLDSSIGATDISVKTVNNIVELSGRAKSKTEKNKAAKIARSISSVSTVKNNIQIHH